MVSRPVILVLNLYFGFEKDMTHVFGCSCPCYRLS